MWEDEATHRRSLEKAELAAFTDYMATKPQEQQRGQWMALAITVAAFLLSAILAFQGREIFASVLGGTTVVSIALAFLKHRPIDPARASKGPSEREVRSEPNT